MACIHRTNKKMWAMQARIAFMQVVLLFGFNAEGITPLAWNAAMPLSP